MSLVGYAYLHRSLGLKAIGSDLSKLVMMCLDNEGKVSKHRRKQFQYSVPEQVFEFIEEEVGRVVREVGKFPID